MRELRRQRRWGVGNAQVYKCTSTNMKDQVGLSSQIWMASIN